ncbi:hypothetical protein COX93_00495 [Candidatus Nomurabacteria bacterium CG_4_10_14_0_2_um_filter_30_12]|uniref:Uncharacterized protein n=3 Tax=Candidatus Nomuraibacteriota TaxID=1752729 RepID=A0A1J4UY94_9BACT|nr:MAG: hypothetical protein AUJ22_00635 [Candidatus Nomurabacteria bacterium CG1_02_31_12]PIR68912.1 MAG: hypothetical protein COU48_01490 [Candidatus Nomurabacteria bacterium CG10_big_fil_rev_8_21_14_0_10_03_31_7]PIZ87587.1 MAG: hypothetical protein COX93_00495 [Candidatus Nomurabacteria bacterium CG_4_10_14_0_2_um_filter_30_12]
MKNIIYYVISNVDIIFCFNLIFSFLGIIILKKRKLYKNYVSYVILTGLVRILIFINFFIIITYFLIKKEIGEEMCIFSSIFISIFYEFCIFLFLYLILVVFIKIFYKPDGLGYLIFLGTIFIVFLGCTTIITVLLYILVPT